MRILALLIYLLSIVSINGQQDTFYIPTPTGQYNVGTITYEWMDSSRTIILSSNVIEQRVIVVQIWYPAELGDHAQKAPYAPLYPHYQNVQANSFLRLPFSRSINNSPLIIVVPGRGIERFLYSGIAEELASHGYVVASIDMPLIGSTVYNDGFIIKPSQAFRPPPGMMGGPYEKVDEFFEAPVKIGTEDLAFAYNRIVGLNKSDPNGRFTNRIDVHRIGLFGHSLGGRIAGQFAVDRKEVQAYISMEGIPPRVIRYEGLMKIPVALLCSSGTWPYARDNYFSLIDNRNHPVFMIELKGFGHNSLTDMEIIKPGNRSPNIHPVNALDIGRKISRNYFDSVFKSDLSFAESIKIIEHIRLNTYE